MSERVDDIVLVDDEPMVAEFVRRVLRRSALGLRHFAEPEAALEYLRGHSARVLLVDTRMPGMHGPELLAALAREGRLGETHVFLCSAGRVMPDEYPLPELPHLQRLSKDELFDRSTLLERLVPPAEGRAA